MQDQEVEAFGLTAAQLNVLIATCYEDVGWIPEDHGVQRSVTSAIKKLVDDDLVYITNMVREVSTIHSFGDSGFAKVISNPASMHCVIAVTEEGRQLVDQINLSLRADACTVEGDIYVIRNFIGTLSIEDLPEFLSHGRQELREEAAKRLADCLESMPAGDLPELLTDSDSVVRDVASGVLIHTTGAEE